MATMKCFECGAVMLQVSGGIRCPSCGAMCYTREELNAVAERLWRESGLIRPMTFEALMAQRRGQS